MVLFSLICQTVRYERGIYSFGRFWSFSQGRQLTKTRLFKYIESFTTKKGNFSEKKIWYFSYSSSKHRLWHSLEPPRHGGSIEFPLYFFSKMRKIVYAPVNLSFTIQLWGLRGQNYIGVFPWWFMASFDILSHWCWEPDLDLIVSVPEFTYLLSCLISRTPVPFWKGIYSTRKEFAPKGANFFL